jgi:hypothetical protein
VKTPAGKHLSDDAIESVKREILFGAGYKRPPESGRFKTGQSGNPKGRPKKVSLVDDSRSASRRAYIDLSLRLTSCLGRKILEVSGNLFGAATSNYLNAP